MDKPIVKGFLSMDKYIKLYEVQMYSNELIKVNSQTGELRTEIMKRKIHNNEPFELSNGDFFVVTDVEDAIKKIDNLDRINPTNLEFTGEIDGKPAKVLTSKFVKTKEFGGQSGGTRGGSENTDLHESAQCYYCSAVCNVLGKAGNPEDFTPAVLHKAAGFVDATTKVEDVIEKLNDSWTESSIVIANELFKGKYIKKGMYFHRGSKVMNDIYDAARDAAKRTGIPFKNDKWNPGDIWAITSKVDISKLNTTSLPAFNDDILKLYNTRELVAISLKLAKKTAKIDEYNVSKERVNYRPIAYSYSEKGKRSTFETNNKVFLTFNGGVCEGRTFNKFSNWAFEIKGKTAAGGKCGYGPILGILKCNGNNSLNLDYKTIKKMIMTADDNLINEMYELYQKYDLDKNLSADEFKKFIKDKSKKPTEQNWLFSKYTGMRVLAAIDESKKENDIVNDIILYASSQSTFSSAFVKAY